MLIKRLIVQDRRKVCILNNPIEPNCTLEELQEMLKREKIGYFDISVDTVGVAMVTTYKTLGFS